MAGSLRDQLVKAGLATSAQAKKAERQVNRSNTPKSKKSDDPKKPDVKQRAQQLKKAKAEKDRAAARVQNDKYAARASALRLNKSFYKMISGQKPQRILTYPTTLYMEKRSSGCIFLKHKKIN